jgi:hypothetical protein
MADTKLLEKLKKIKDHAASAQEIGNEAEALAFSSMLSNLLAKHKLEMTDLEFTTHIKEEPIGQFMCGGGTVLNHLGHRVFKNYPSLEVQGRRIHWQEELAAVIAQANNCRIMVAPGTAVIWWVGRPSTVTGVDYLYLYMVDTADKLAHKAYMQLRRQMRKQGGNDPELVASLLQETKGFKASFLSSFIWRMAQRLAEEKAKLENDQTGMALMRINTEAKEVREYIEGMNSGKAKATKGQKEGNLLGHERGRATADQLDINSKPRSALN